MRIIALVLSAALSGCTLWGTTGVAPESADLRGHWVHAYEEDAADGIHVYRPADYRTFPPSRFRMAYIFEADGRCQWYYLAPNDAHRFREGTWRMEGDTLYVDQEETVAFQVVTRAPDLLRLRRLDP